VCLCLALEGGPKRSLQLLVAEAAKATLLRDVAVLLRNRALGCEERAEGIKAQEQMPPRHVQAEVPQAGSAESFPPTED